MSTKNDVVIVSAYGRGNWLASELQEIGLRVAMVDCSEALGRWSPEDWEGPFGLLRTDGLKVSQLARLEEEDYSEPVDSGVSVWLPDGPIDLKGPISQHLSDFYDPTGLVEPYLVSYYTATKVRRAELKLQIKKQAFSDVWLAHLAHQLAANVYKPSAAAIDSGQPLPLFSPFFIRRISRRGYEKALDICGGRGIDVIKSSTVRDIRIDRQRFDGIEIEGPRSGVVQAQQFVWMLSSEETERFGEKPARKLFPKGEIRPQWAWIRIIAQVQEGFSLTMLPFHFVVINDLGLPWTHDNMIVVQRSVNPRDADFWLRVPNQNRFQRDYIKDLAEKTIQCLNNRIPGAQFGIQSMPQEFYYDYAELGPARYPVFSETQLAGLGRALLENLHFDGPECWPNLDWTARFRAQEEIFDKIKAWKVAVDQKRTMGETV